MNNLLILKRLLIVILLVSMPTTTLAEKAIGKHALLIGIQDYRSTPFLPSLKAPLNDVKLMKRVLQARFKLQEKDFIILQDRQATHTGIKNAFAVLAEKIKHGDFVYIYYSGHGSHTKDCNGDEAVSDQDQTWVSYGARSSNPNSLDNYDILDDEIAAWLQPIYAKTAQVVFVSDSCHSATVSRGETAIIKAVPPDERIHPLCNKAYPDVINRGVHIGAARDDQLAIEIYEYGKYYSVFTLYWAIALKTRTNKTLYDIFKQAYDNVNDHRDKVQTPQKAQTPQFVQFSQAQRKEGNRGYLGLERDFPSMPQTIEVTNVQNHLVEINAGRIAGVTEGSIYRLYQPNTPKSQNLPRLTIIRVKDFTSLGKAKGYFKKGDLVVEEKHVYPFEPVKVFLKTAEQSRTKNTIQTIYSALRSAFQQKRFPAYALTEKPRHAEQVLSVSYSTPQQKPVLQILSPEGLLLHEHLKIPFHNVNLGLQSLQDTLTHLAHIRELKLLKTDSPQNFPGELQIWHLRLPCEQTLSRCYKLGKNDYKIVNNNFWQAFQGKSLYKDDALAFKIYNRSDDKQYCFYLLEISPDGKIQVLFPTLDQFNQKSACIRANGEATHIHALRLSQTGETFLKLIASQQPIEVSLLERGQFSQHRGVQKTLNPLERLLLNATQGRRTAVKVPTTRQWAASHISFEVH